MNCPKCGAELPEGSLFCSSCGASLQQPDAPATEQQPMSEPQSAPTPEPQPGAQQYVYGGNTQQNNPNTYYNPNQAQPTGKPLSGTTYLVFAILSTVMCCLPAGIAAIVFATKIDKLMGMGDYAGAQDAAKKAKLWTIISAVAGALLIIGIIVLNIFVIGAAASGGYYY